MDNIRNEFKGVFLIINNSNNYYFIINKNSLSLSDNIASYFKIIKLDSGFYNIKLTIYKSKFLGVDSKDKIIAYNKENANNNPKVCWDIIKIKKNNYIIKNIYNNKYINDNNNVIKCIKLFTNNLNYIYRNTNIYKSFIFKLFKVYEEPIFNKNISQIIENEPIDIIMKYIDLSDKTLNRSGITQTYKDQDNEELRYSLRSIFNYIPWIRKVYILMPNEKVKYLKYIEDINDKIIYIKDKDLLGYDTSNIQSFLFSLDKMEKFGIAKNFIYMEDDCFIGKFLKKTDFFYYDNKRQNVFPNIITWGFYILNKTEVINEYSNLVNMNLSVYSHSKKGFMIQRLNTEKFFIDNYNISLIRPLFTHNAIAENIDDLKEMNNEAKKYKFINETLFIKERNIFSLCQEHFFNLYQLNIKHRKTHPILSLYVPIELINKKKLNRALFVINTGGNHIPLERHYKLQKKVLKNRFPFYNIYEIKYKKDNYNYFKKYFKLIINIFILVKVIKIYNIILILYIKYRNFKIN